jgi:signal transduction histidine kinase
VHAVTSGETTVAALPAAMAPARRWAWFARGLPVPAVDVLVAAVVAVPTVMDAWWNEVGTRQADWITYTLAGVSIAALLVRRRWPIGVSLTCGSVLTAWYLMDHHGEMLNLPTMVALYTVAVEGDRRRSVVVGAVAAAWSGTLGFTDSDPAGAPGSSPILEMLWPLIPLVLGEAVRTRRELLDEYAARATRAEAEREREARHRVQAERLRIAREFHDVVAHTMAAVNVQMGVAAAAFDARPDTARDALVQARRSSKEALHELRATIALLRDGDQAVPAGAGAFGSVPAPVPRLADLAELADRTRVAGLAVTLTVDGAIGDHELPATVELAAYRIVQEALANVLRHAGARTVAITLAAEAGALLIEVVDDGSPAAPSSGRAGAGRGHGATAGHDRAATPSRAGPVPRPAMPVSGPGGGYGLLGMAERAAALGGTVDHGPVAGGGFRIVARLPVAPAEPDRPPGPPPEVATP